MYEKNAKTEVAEKNLIKRREEMREVVVRSLYRHTVHLKYK